MIVLDAGAAVGYLMRRDPGWDALAAWIRTNSVHAPHLLDYEVASALRGLVRGRQISPKRGHGALLGLTELDVTRYPAGLLLSRIWDLRGHLTAYDAAYVALAEVLAAPLLTTDERLARSSGHTAEIVTPLS